jgi:hypothetical protein
LLLDPLAQVLDEVKAVSNLDRLRSTVPGAFGKETVPVAANDFDVRMRPQPGRVDINAADVPQAIARSEMSGLRRKPDISAV